MASSRRLPSPAVVNAPAGSTRSAGSGPRNRKNRPAGSRTAWRGHRPPAGRRCGGGNRPIVGFAPPLILTWLLSAAQIELVEVDRDVAVSVVYEHRRLVTGDRGPVGAREVESQGERAGLVPLVHVEVTPGGGLPAVGDPGAIIGGYHLAGLGERRPYFVAVREEGDVIDQVAGEQGALCPVEGISVARVGRIRLVEGTVNIVGLCDRLAVRAGREGGGWPHRVAAGKQNRGTGELRAPAQESVLVHLHLLSPLPFRSPWYGIQKCLDKDSSQIFLIQDSSQICLDTAGWGSSGVSAQRPLRCVKPPGVPAWLGRG